MNLRWRMLKHKSHSGKLFMLVNAWFFFAYIVCRIVFMATLLIRNYQI